MDDKPARAPLVSARNGPVLVLQIGIIALCSIALALFAANFPFPSPLIRPFLPPKLRWPTEQVVGWVEAGNASSTFREFFARDPDRHVPEGANLVSPSDGIVQRIVYRDGTTFLVIGLSFWDVHVVRTPAAGVVTDVDQEGIYLAKSPTKQQLEEQIFLQGKPAPVQENVSLKTSYGPLKVRLITSYWASRLKIWVHEGDRLAKGQRIGRILLGSTVVIEMPGRVRLPLKIGQRVVGGETRIFEGARLP